MVLDAKAETGSFASPAILRRFMSGQLGEGAPGAIRKGVGSIPSPLTNFRKQNRGLDVFPQSDKVISVESKTVH